MRSAIIVSVHAIHIVRKNDMERPDCIYHGNDINVYLGRPRGMMGPLTKRSIHYSAIILQVFNFANFQPFAKLFQQKFLMCDVLWAWAYKPSSIY